jgi:hypothetical protein
MREAILRVLPSEGPGLTLAEILDAVTPLLPEAQFPDRKTIVWYGRTVPNDMIVSGLIDPVPNTQPMRYLRVSSVTGAGTP